MAYEATKVRFAGLGQSCGISVLVLGLMEPDLHELVLEQGRRDGRGHGAREPCAAHLHQGVARLREGAEEAALLAIEGSCGRRVRRRHAR